MKGLTLTSSSRSSYRISYRTQQQLPSTKIYFFRLSCELTPHARNLKPSLVRHLTHSPPAYRDRWRTEQHDSTNLLGDFFVLSATAVVALLCVRASDGEILLLNKQVLVLSGVRASACCKQSSLLVAPQRKTLAAPGTTSDTKRYPSIIANCLRNAQQHMYTTLSTEAQAPCMNQPFSKLTVPFRGRTSSPGKKLSGLSAKRDCQFEKGSYQHQNKRSLCLFLRLLE